MASTYNYNKDGVNVSIFLDDKQTVFCEKAGTRTSLDVKTREIRSVFVSKNEVWPVLQGCGKVIKGLLMQNRLKVPD